VKKYSKKHPHGVLRWRTSPKAKIVKKARFINPMGESLIIVGGNPMRRMFSLGKFRRNPDGAVGALRGAVRVGDWAPLAVTGGLAAVATGAVPLMLQIVNPWMRYGAQVGTAFLGGWAAGTFAGREHGKVFTIVGTSLVAYDLLKNFVFARFFPGIPLGDYDTYEEAGAASQQVGAGYPENDMSAYPEEVGAYPEEVGAYPYDGQYGY
jgi:hypothetical protein